MPTVIEGVLDASGKRFALIASRFNELISRKLLEGDHVDPEWDLEGESQWAAALVKADSKVRLILNSLKKF